MSTLVIIALLAAAAPQIEAPKPLDKARVRARAEAYRDYALCIVRGRPNAARDAVRAYSSPKDVRQRHDGLIRNGCVSGVGGSLLWFAGDMYIYALAEALIRDNYLGKPVPDFAAVPPLPQRATPVYDASKLPTDKGKALTAAMDYDREANQAFLGRYGECIVRARPVEALALIATAPFTDAETAAFASLQPALAPCIMGGKTVKFGRPSLRGAIAFSYWRLADAAQARVASAARTN